MVIGLMFGDVVSEEASGRAVLGFFFDDVAEPVRVRRHREGNF